MRAWKSGAAALAFAVLCTGAFLSASAWAEEAGESVTGSEEVNTAEVKHVSVHDPSILRTEEGEYYLLGSHTASASSEDLIHWTQLNWDYGNGKNLPFYGNLNETFEVPFQWAGFDDGDCAGNGYAIWAPDAIFNPRYQWEDGEEGAYMLYVCTSSTWRRSCICYLVSKDPKGPYSYVDTIMYSGFTQNGEPDGNSKRDTTWDNDYLGLKALVEKGAANGGIDEVSGKWFTSNGGWDHTYAPNAIDPNVFFDASGEKMYMSYGSWSGGMWLLELDPATGEAIYPGVDSVDEVSGNYVDRYFGVHLIGGDHASGEGPYIRYDKETGYYFLYCTYGGLASAGGYNMRLFRSRDVTGPYLDAAGNNAADNKGNQDKYGIKLIGNYAFQDQIGKKAAGHNSELVDADGYRYLFYHQRFDITPQLEAHEVRVHQQFLNEDEWPVTAVYEYRGEEPEHYEDTELVGSYEFVNHGTKTNGDMLVTSILTLEEDGTVTGAAEGSWEKSDSGRGYDYVTMKLDGVTYKGYFFRQRKENADPEPVMTFTCLGEDNTCIWGSAMGGAAGEMVANMAAEALKKEVLAAVREYGTLPAEIMGCQVVWHSPDTSVITEEGKVNPPAEKVKLDLEAEISSGDVTITQTYHVTVK